MTQPCYAKYQLCSVSFMLSVIYKPFMLSVVMLNVIMLNIIMLNVIRLNIIMLNIIVLNVIVLNIIMLSVVMLNVVAPLVDLHNYDKRTSLLVITTNVL